MATISPVSLFLHLNTTPYDPSPIFPNFSNLSICEDVTYYQELTISVVIASIGEAKSQMTIKKLRTHS